MSWFLFWFYLLSLFIFLLVTISCIIFSINSFILSRTLLFVYQVLFVFVSLLVCVCFLFLQPCVCSKTKIHYKCTVAFIALFHYFLFLFSHILALKKAFSYFIRFKAINNSKDMLIFQFSWTLHKDNKMFYQSRNLNGLQRSTNVSSSRYSYFNQFFMIVYKPSFYQGWYITNWFRYNN